VFSERDLTAFLGEPAGAALIAIDGVALRLTGLPAIPRRLQ
jgi:hypothetical protein